MYVETSTGDRDEVVLTVHTEMAPSFQVGGNFRLSDKDDDTLPDGGNIR